MTIVTTACDDLGMGNSPFSPYTLAMIHALVAAAAVALPSVVFGQAALAPSASPQRPRAAAPSALETRTAVVALEGFIEVERPGAHLREKVSQAPFSLSPGDRVHTLGQGKATVRFAEGSEVVLDDYAVLAIEEERRDRITLNLVLGKVWVAVTKLKRRKFEVRTPVAVASVRGTMFSVEAAARRSAVEVFGGRVAVIGARGDEALLGANQRIDVLEGRLGAVTRFEGRPELPRLDPRRREQKKDEDKKEGEKRDRRDRPAPGDRAEHRPPSPAEFMRSEVEREVGFQVQRNALEAQAAFDGKNALYQEGKNLIDAFGRRVRSEQYLTRPDPSSFKVTTVNLRENRVDKSILEVSANKALPSDIRQAGNLYFSATGMPEWWATRQRWTFTNGFDKIIQLNVDGKPAPIEFLASGVPVCTASGCTFGGNIPAPGQFWQTIFGHKYEFMTSGQTASDAVMNDIWTTAGAGAVRPLDDVNMMWHTQPMKTVVTDLVTSAQFGFWQDAFMVTDVANNVGKAYIDRSFNPIPGAAFNVTRRDYVGFVDTTGRGFLNFGDKANVSGAPFGLANNVDVKVSRLWDGTLTPNTGGTAFPAFVAGRNETIFVSRNGTFLPGGNPSFAAAGFRDPNVLGWINANPSNDWLVAQNFVINDFGQIHTFAGGPAAQNNLVEVGQAYEAFNYERNVRSSRFGGRDIDVVMDPHFYIQSGLISPDHQQQGIGR